MPSNKIDIEIKDSYMLLITDEVRQPVAMENVFVSQANSGSYPVYLDTTSPKWRYTLYSKEVENELVYHVGTINGVEPKDNDDIFAKLFKEIGV